MAHFRDRGDAGRQLAARLSNLAAEQPIVLGLPRGGVPVAAVVAAALHAPLDVLLVRKIGVPGQEELALGALVDGDPPQLVLNEDVAAVVRPAPAFVEAAKRRQVEEIGRRRTLYRGDRPALSVAERTVIVVDDGIATGATVRAALRGLRAAGAGRIVLAVPVAPAETVAALGAECDAVVCLHTPEPFHAVGLHYDDFGQTSDREVVELLESAARRQRDSFIGK